MFCSRNYFTTVPWLLHLVAPVILGEFSPIFPLFALFHHKSRLFYMKEPREQSIFFPDSLRALGYFCPSFYKATLHLRSTHAPTKNKHQKNTKNRYFCKKNSVFFAQKRCKGLYLHCKKLSLTCTNDLPMKKGACSKFSRTITHLSDTSGLRGRAFATQFFHIQTS